MAAYKELLVVTGTAGPVLLVAIVIAIRDELRSLYYVIQGDIERAKFDDMPQRDRGWFYFTIRRVGLTMGAYGSGVALLASCLGLVTYHDDVPARLQPGTAAIWCTWVAGFATGVAILSLAVWLSALQRSVNLNKWGEG